MFSPIARHRLESEIIIWMTTVDPKGQPQTAPVWFLFETDSFLVYSLDPTPRLRNIAANPHVALNLDGDGSGGGVVTIEGTAEVDPDAPRADQVDGYLVRYRDRMERGWGSPAAFAAKYPTAVRITPVRAREWGHSR